MNIQGQHVEIIDLNQEIADYLSPRLNGKEDTKWSPKADVESYKTLSSDDHQIVYICLKVPSTVAEENLKHLANELNKIDKKFRIKGFLLKAAAIELVDHSYRLISYPALSPADAEKFNKLYKDKYDKELEL